MDRKDLERLPQTGWIAFLEGADPGYPERALQRDFESLRANMQAIQEDPTTPETRLADWLLDLNPARTGSLVNLMLGGHLAGRIWTLHSRVRYFDPERRRSGLPRDVAALVEKLTGDTVTLTLVNTSPFHSRDLIVQAGAYGEHRFQSVTLNGKTVPIEGPSVRLRLQPGCGSRLVFSMQRYANQPTLAPPWDSQ